MYCGFEETSQDSHSAYFLKVEVLEVRTPQIILIFRKIIVWERENYQLCSVEFCHREQKL